MKIIRDSAANCVDFKNVNYGVVFKYGDYFYIKMDLEARTQRDERINTVCLNNGEAEYFKPTERVKIVDASLIIKE